MVDTKIDEREVVALAIRSLRQESKSLGVHSKYDDFYTFLRTHLKGDVVEIVKRLEAEEFLISRPSPGGYMVYLREEAPESVFQYHAQQERVAEAHKAMEALKK